MFQKSIDDRLSEWSTHRNNLNTSLDPLTDVWEFWKNAPYIPYNRDVDPFNSRAWPTPWEIIVNNKYDDFTKALMIARSLKFTKRFENSKIEIRCLVNSQHTCYYNVVCVDDEWAINFNDTGPVKIEEIPEAFYPENVIEIKFPR